jgi:hypothetical protein
MKDFASRLERFRALCAQVNAAVHLTGEEREAARALATEVDRLAAELEALTQPDPLCPTCPAGPMRLVFSDRQVVVYVCDACACSLSVPLPFARAGQHG